MANEQQQPPTLTPARKPFDLIPVVLKEAAFDSPTFRATAVHFGEQVDIVEKWLEGYVKAASKVAQEVTALDNVVNQFLSYSAAPQYLSEAVVDHDYTILALRRYSEGAREHWSNTLKSMKRMETSMVDPIRTFLQNDLRGLKEARKALDQAQKLFDNILVRYAGQAKSKEPSALREDAFQLHESRKAYLRASMDFCVMAPQVRSTLDKLLVRIFSDQWREMKNSRESTTSAFVKWASEMERIRGWSKEMEEGDRFFKRELQLARRQIEETAEATARPSRELDDYTTPTVPFLGQQGPVRSPAKPGPDKSEKQGWLFQRTLQGKPTRTVWVRRWFFAKNGIFGWLIQGGRSGAVEESEKTGVLLCSVRPAFQEERRFCFEVKTKDTSVILQAETQAELVDWISAFEGAKRKALEDPASTDSGASSAQIPDPAFAISPPVAPEFAARAGDGGHTAHGSDETLTLERAATMAIPGADIAPRGSSDVSRRVTGFAEKEESSSRDHAARIIQKLDLHRKSTASPQMSGSAAPPPPPAGGIASLISASHNLLPPGTMAPAPSVLADTRIPLSPVIPTSTLAPSTLANPPAPTNLSKTAVIVSGERGVSLGQTDGGMPGGLMANLWGSTNWGYINRLERGELKQGRDRSQSQPPSPTKGIVTGPLVDGFGLDAPPGTAPLPVDVSPAPIRPTGHRKTISLTSDAARLQRPSLVTEDFPNLYPLPLKAQDAQFRILFPYVPREDKVVLVFRATWNPNEQQEFPGRVYVTVNDVFFYSNHLGLVLITGVPLSSIDEITAAPGKDNDFLFVHFKEGAWEDSYTRVTIKTFVEPLKLLQRRLNFLVRNCNSLPRLTLEEVLKTLIKMETEGASESPTDSWEDISVTTPLEGPENHARHKHHDAKPGLRIDGNLFPDPTRRLISRNATKLKLPSQPVVYTPPGMDVPVVEREFSVTTKALFHVMFGDKSTLFDILYRERWAEKITKSPWVQPDNGYHRRDFQYHVKTKGSLGHARNVSVTDYQVINVFNDHLCYVITDKKTPWHLPYSQSSRAITKFVITHIAKSRCKLAIYTYVEYPKPLRLFRPIVERAALEDLRLDAMDLVDVVTDQVQRLGINSQTRRAVQIFGNVGQVPQTTELNIETMGPASKNRRLKLQPRTLAGMVLEKVYCSILAALLAALGWILDVIVGGIVKVGSQLIEIMSAQRVLVVLLLASFGWNLWVFERDAVDWWRERNAGLFMKRIGVGIGSNEVMGRAVWLRDIEQEFINRTDIMHPSDDDGRCFSTFSSLLFKTSSFSSHSPPWYSGFSKPNSHQDQPPYSPHFLSQSTRSTASRLARTRQNLASYRHDLLVSLRVVNRVEREMLQAEWENWLLDENLKCRRLGVWMLANERDDDRLKKTMATEEGEQITGLSDDAHEWYREYCGSCKRELEEVGRREGVIFSVD